MPGRVDIYTVTAAASGRIEMTKGGGPCVGISVGFAPDSVAPRVYTPINQCYEVGIGEMNAGQTYDLIVWSATGATGPYTFTATVVP